MLGEKIKIYRENKNMTQNEIAEVLGVKPATVSKYESGTLEPNIESLKRVAQTFNITIDELIKDEEKFDISKVNILKTLREQKEIKLKGNLYSNTQITFAYNTNHIEGSTLTYAETYAILYNDNSFKIEGKEPREIYETINRNIKETEGFRKIQVFIQGSDIFHQNLKKYQI